MGHQLEGTVALVTGASSGIGAAIACGLANEGAAVALLARREVELRALADRIAADGGQALPVVVDVTDPTAAAAAVERVAGELGRIDIAVNNAGTMLLGSVEDAPIEEWRRMIDVNVYGALYVTRAVLGHLGRAADDGLRNVADLVNISSHGGRHAVAGTAVYNATKFALGAFSEALRQEVTKTHVRVAVVEPGMTATDIGRWNRPEAIETVLGRFGRAAGPITPLQPADVADAVTYIVTRPRHVAVNELLLRPTEQV
jgi:NADP-dependent 3-hydroxy acid dehydrogenase YdfG